MALKKEHFIDLHGKNYCLFPGLLAAAHEAGLKRTETHIEQIPSEQNKHTAVVRSTVYLVDADGRETVYTCVGDASPATTKLTAYLRMAETRALARCFRLALNVGETSLEELEDESGRPSQSVRNYDRDENERSTSYSRREESSVGGCSWDGCNRGLTPGQVTYSMKNFNAPLCSEHQKQARELVK